MTESAQKILFAFSPLRIPAIIRSCFCILIVVSVAYGQTTYYVSSSTGSDGNSGTSAGTPWRTMNKVSKTSFSPGDSILFKRGDTFYYGELSKEGAGWIGTSNAPIVMASYGSGNLPILYGDFTGATWTKTTEFGHDSIWQTYAGICLSGQGWEFYGGTWNIMTHDVLNAVFSMNNTDSLKKFLNSLTTDSFGPASATNNTGDTIYVKTHDGLSPNVHIFRSNVLTGTYLTVRDLEFRNWWTGVDPYNGNHEVFRHLKMRNNRYVAIFLSGGTSNSLVDSCRCDSTGYDAIYGFGGDHNRFNYDTVQTVTETILGIDHKVELAGIGVQQDTSVVIDHCYFADCELDGMAGFFNVQDTVRYCTFSNVATGLYLNGEGWVAHNNTIVVNGSASAPAIQVDLHGGSTPTSVYNNTVTTNGNALLFNSSNAVGGTVSFHNNSVTLTGPSNTRFVDFQVTTGITSTNNSFSGTGVFNAGKFPSEHIYNTLASFHAATGYENGSIWFSGSGSPTGTFTVAPDSLPANGGTVTLQWTSVNATSASISYTIGSVDTAITVNTNGSISINVSVSTLFTLTLAGPFGTTTLNARVIAGSTPLDYFLNQNYPNPFNASTTIEFGLPKDENVSLKVYDLLGREIATLVEGMQASGVHVTQWNPKAAASGVYRYRLNAGSYSKTRRMVIVR